MKMSLQADNFQHTKQIKLLHMWSMNFIVQHPKVHSHGQEHYRIDKIFVTWNRKEDKEIAKNSHHFLNKV